MTMQQCEKLIDLLDSNGIDTEAYKFQFCELIATPPSETFWDKLCDDLQIEVLAKATNIGSEHIDTFDAVIEALTHTGE